jgi:hypothetical protein
MPENQNWVRCNKILPILENGPVDDSENRWIVINPSPNQLSSFSTSPFRCLSTHLFEGIPFDGKSKSSELCPVLERGNTISTSRTRIPISGDKD